VDVSNLANEERKRLWENGVRSMIELEIIRSQVVLIVEFDKKKHRSGPQKWKELTNLKEGYSDALEKLKSFLEGSDEQTCFSLHDVQRKWREDVDSYPIKTCTFYWCLCGARTILAHKGVVNSDSNTKVIRFGHQSECLRLICDCFGGPEKTFEKFSHAISVAYSTSKVHSSLNEITNGVDLATYWSLFEAVHLVVALSEDIAAFTRFYARLEKAGIAQEAFKKLRALLIAESAKSSADDAQASEVDDLLEKLRAFLFHSYIWTAGNQRGLPFRGYSAFMKRMEIHDKMLQCFVCDNSNNNNNNNNNNNDDDNNDDDSNNLDQRRLQLLHWMRAALFEE
jgi:hypothetical protein